MPYIEDATKVYSSVTQVHVQVLIYEPSFEPKNEKLELESEIMRRICRQGGIE